MRFKIKRQKENTSRKVDSLGRISIPKAIRDRLNIKVNDELDFYTFEDNGVSFVCMTNQEKKIKYFQAAQVLDELGIEIPQKLADLI